MTPDLPWHMQESAYEEHAQAYLRSLPMEHFMESTDQAAQRQITLESLDLVTARRPEVRVFNELLVQYPLRNPRKPGQIVPDNMVVLTTEPIRAYLSYNVHLEAAPPFWVFEYVWKGSRRKDYGKSFRKYERYLKVPYYLLFHLDIEEMTLFHLKRGKYVTVKPNKEGRCAIRELDMEVGILDDWVRYWYQGKLLPSPAELQHDLDAAQQAVEDAQRETEQARQTEEEAKKQARAEKLRADYLQQRIAQIEVALAESRRQLGKS